MEIIELLDFAIKQQASDLHLSSGLRPMLRVNGEICKINLPELSANQVKIMLYTIMSDGVRQVFEQQLEVYFAFSIANGARFRANLFMQLHGMAAVLRIIHSKILSLEELNSPAIFREIAGYRQGLVLVS